MTEFHFADTFTQFPVYFIIQHSFTVDDYNFKSLTVIFFYIFLCVDIFFLVFNLGYLVSIAYYQGACDWWYSDAEHYWFISLVDPLPFGRKHRRSSTTLTSTVDVRTSLLFQLFV